jgi:hypothetical protein
MPADRQHVNADGTAKRAWPIEQNALMAARRAQQQGLPLEPYRCHICGEWHLGHPYPVPRVTSGALNADALVLLPRIRG